MSPADHIHRLLKFDLIARCAILTQVVFTCALAWFVKTSLTAKLIATGASSGYAVLVVLTVIAVACVLDIVVNDLLPDSYVLASVKKRRHLLYHVVAGLYFIQAFAGIGTSLDVEDILCLSYLFTGGLSAWYSWAVSLRATHV